MFNPDQNRLAPTLAMIMAASLVGFITGYTVPLISLELAQQQIAPLYVGLHDDLLFPLSCAVPAR